MSTFPAMLHADGSDPERAEKLTLYGFLVGAWETEIIVHGPDGATHRGLGEIHAGWVLEGRAVQDIWMIPRKAERVPSAPVLPLAGNWYGTTLRVYDPTIDAWHIHWLDPATNQFRQQIGRAEGPDIVQLGTLDNGACTRWRFTKITPNSFHWLGELSTDQGANWLLLVEVLAQRC